MNQKPFLLLTNDDGIDAPGIKHLFDSVKDFGTTAVVAPRGEKSGAGASITWTKPLTVETRYWEENHDVWSINGTPVDCVKMACSTLLEKAPDMVLSGINRGSNAGRTVFYSGTVGGVIEGTLRGIPGIAFSFCDFTTPSISATKPYIIPLVEYFLKRPMPSGTFINVNFPPDCENGVKGLKFAKQGRGYWTEEPEKRTHPAGIPYYWLGGKWSSFEEDLDSDIALLEKGFITVVPIHIGELTNTDLLQKEKQTIELLFSNPHRKEESTSTLI